MLDFLALEEAQAAVDAVGNLGVDQHVFQQARLSVGAIEHGHVGQIEAVALEAAHFVDDEFGFLAVGVGFEQADFFAFAGVGPQVLPSRPSFCSINALAALRILPIER